MSTNTMVRPPFSLRFQVVDADGTVILTAPGPQVELESLKSFGRAVGAVAMLHDLLKRTQRLLIGPGRFDFHTAAVLAFQITKALDMIDGRESTQTAPEVRSA